jgi:cystathionine beta-lyase/cystathionine gamma-synthase
MKFESQVVHRGDRKREGQSAVASTTPISLATTYFYDSAAKLDRVMGNEEPGFSYARYSNPTNEALEELTAALEGGAGSLATSSGMAALQIGFQAALVDRKPSLLVANAIYGATVELLEKFFAPFGVEVNYIDMFNLEAVENAMAKYQPSCLFLETISNPLVRVGNIRALAALAKAGSAALMVDSTFATPMLVRPLELGADLVIHSATKYLAGHGDVLGGIVVASEPYYETIRSLARISGPALGPFESYLTMRGMKTLALRFERQCCNAKSLACWLAQHQSIERVHYCADPNHADADVIRDSFAPGLFGAILSFEIRNADKDTILKFMDKLQMIVPGTSLGDVHTLLLYPAMASHRNLSPKMRERLGIRDNLVRIAVGIEHIEDIKADLDQALATLA